ncbi:MAG: LytTR family transcriptional regulator DNA-binding domain-containing protein [Bacteroidetes bacterium]|nr:LytTR family transcriptional regulator DNA-binding domain-containing protein [Bacteroidota bacterium]
MRNILFVIFLRNAGFYLFFTVFKLYLQTKATALIEKKEALSHDGLILLLPLRGKPISININYVSYFSHERNLTFIHDTEGKASSIYSTLSNIQEYLGDSCLRVNKENIITFTNIISYNEREVIVKDGKDNKQSSLTYSKKDAQNILNTLREKVPSLEEKRIDKKKQNEGVNVQKDDGKCEFEGIKKLILEEINNFPGINTITLTQKFGKKSSLSTIERKLKELKESGLIEFRGAPKTGGYYPV